MNLGPRRVKCVSKFVSTTSPEQNFGDIGREYQVYASMPNYGYLMLEGLSWPDGRHVFVNASRFEEVTP